jgi:hypothetical protein
VEFGTRCIRNETVTDVWNLPFILKIRKLVKSLRLSLITLMCKQPVSVVITQ